MTDTTSNSQDDADLHFAWGNNQGPAGQCASVGVPVPPANLSWHERVPAITQYASPELIEAIAYRGHPREDDPNWPASGAPSKEDYAFWAGRWCGLACLAMALHARDGRAPTLWELLADALAYGVYQLPGDGTAGAGLLYRPFTRFTEERHDLKAKVITDLSPLRLRDELAAGHLVIASVHKEIRRFDRPAPGRGGHLVLVIDHPGEKVAFRNPSGHTPATTAATLPADVFDTFAAHRGISLHVEYPLSGDTARQVLSHAETGQNRSLRK